MASHYAEAFTLLSGRCFRMATDPEPRRPLRPAGGLAWALPDPG